MLSLLTFGWLLSGCVHVPPEVAAVVKDSDPAAINNFMPKAPPDRAAANAPPAPR